MDLDTLLVIALLLAATAPFVVALYRANELFVLEVVQGELTVRRGSPPPRLLSEMRDIVKLPQLARVTLRATLEDRRPMLRARGEIDEGQMQRLRNVTGLFTAQQLRAGQGRAAKKPKKR